MISAFKHIRLSGYNLTPVQDGNSLRLGFGNSGLAYYSELTGISGYLQGLINTANADVSSINVTGYSAAGNLAITGLDGVKLSFNTATNTIEVNGNSGYFQALSNQINTDLATTGSNLYNLLIGFSGGLSTSFASSQSFTDLSGNIASTGSILDSKINSLSGYVTGANATFASITNLALTGSTLDTKINTLSGYVTGANSTFTTNLASTGSILHDRIGALSGYANATFVAKTSQQVFFKDLTPTNLDAYAVMYPVPFLSTPKIQATLELDPSSDVMYNLSVRNIGLEGYTGLLSDNILEPGAKIHTFAST
jgi:hypothetical protein